MIRSDAAVNRRRVLEAADAVLAEQGVAARMDEIARRAGVGVGTLYRHFATKENLYAAVVAARVDLLLEEAGRLRETADPRVAFGTFAARIVADAGRQRPLTDALREAGVDVKAGQADQRAAMHAALSGLLERAQQAGAVRPDVGLPEVLALLRGAGMAAETGDYSEAVLERTLAVLLDGLQAVPRPA